MKKIECLAMLLAGGQGSRLGLLTKKVAKPAVPYGGKYRIIDFPLSNCVNSGIETVGVLTQYQPLELNEYLGNGHAWDLDRASGGLHILSPYQQIEGTEWYKNTANAIYQNINFIDRYNPEYVAVLSGDHIYKMDYNEMLQYHKDHQAVCTIAVMEVPWEEAPRFGIMNTNEDWSIYEFQEKPAEPKSNKASMGVYIFSWKELREYLIADENDADSKHDFGQNIIPAMLGDGKKLMAFPFEGYWKDVGTIASLWEANLDLINPNVDLDLSDNSWKIYSNSPIAPPHFMDENAYVQNSVVAEGCYIGGNVESSVISSNVEVEKGAEIIDSVIMPGATIKKGAKVLYSIVAENAVIEEDAQIGELPESLEPGAWGVSMVGPNTTVAKGMKVKAGESYGNKEEQ